MSSKSEASSSATTTAAAVKKKRVIVVSPCPPSVATAYIILRGALYGLLGIPASATAAEVSLLQPTYIKEGVPSAKFSIQLGKKLGCGTVELPTSNDQKEAFWDALEAIVQRLLLLVGDDGGDQPQQQQHAAAAEIKVTCRLTKAQAVEKYGNAILNGGMKKVKDDAIVTVAQLRLRNNKTNNNNDDVCSIMTCVPPAIPSKRMITSIILDRTQSSITSTARKAEVTIKFRVSDDDATLLPVILTTNDDNNDNNDDDNDEPFPAMPNVALLPEGKVLLDLQNARKEQEALAALVAETQTAVIAAAKAAAIDAAAATTVPTTDANADANADADKNDSDEMVVNAFEVKGKIDYDKLVDKFGSKLISPDLLKRLEAQTVGKGRVPFLHRFLRRDIFFSHRDLSLLLDCAEEGRPFYLYTGRGPSSAAMHLGHLVPFQFTQWLQQAFDCPLVIQMTDDEKFLFKGEYQDDTGDNLQYFADLTIENARDIISCGFNKEKTFLFSDLDYVGTMYPNIVRIWKAVTTNTVNGIFGFDGTSNIGKIAFPAIQAAPAFFTSFPTVLKDAPLDTACLIPCAIDQDPYFRMTRDVAHKLIPKSKSAAAATKQHKLGGKPALIHSKFFPPLQGAEGKMSSSDANSAIFLTDAPDEIDAKIKKHAFSGGQETKQLQQELGANLDVDVSYQWLRFFLEDDEELESIGASYSSGSGDYWSTGAVKKRLIDELQVLVAAHQERRATITDDEVREWMVERNIM